MFRFMRRYNLHRHESRERQRQRDILATGDKCVGLPWKMAQGDGHEKEFAPSFRFNEAFIYG